MLKVHFCDTVEDSLLRFAVIVAKSHGKWVFCKHKDRNTWECPGGHREPEERIGDTARRELYEETGAIEYDLNEVCVYGVEQGEQIAYGMLYYANIAKFGPLPPLEIERIELLENLPDRWTYPEIQAFIGGEGEDKQAAFLKRTEAVGTLWRAMRKNETPAAKSYRFIVQ